MLHKLSIFSCAIFLVFAMSPAFAHEIHLKDGRTIHTKECWQEDGFVTYEKFGAVVRIPKDKVKQITYDDREVIKPATIYFNNGHSIYCNSSWEKDGQVYCDQYKADYFYDKEDVAGILKGRTHKFEELPTVIQKQWTAATVYLKSRQYLHADKVWTEGDNLFCQTSSEDYIFPIGDVLAVKKGHIQHQKQTPSPSRETISIDKHEIGQKVSNRRYKKSLEPIGKSIER